MLSILTISRPPLIASVYRIANTNGTAVGETEVAGDRGLHCLCGRPERDIPDCHLCRLRRLLRIARTEVVAGRI